MNAIISTSINFQSAADVAAYMQLDPVALPEDDMAYTEVTRYIVGFESIVLFGVDGRRLAKFRRRNVRGFAVDGEPVVIHGENFKRIGIPEDDPQPTADADENEEDAPADHYRVEWDDWEGNHHEKLFARQTDAEAEYDAALKEYQNAELTDLTAQGAEDQQ